MAAVPGGIRTYVISITRLWCHQEMRRANLELVEGIGGLNVPPAHGGFGVVRLKLATNWAQPQVLEGFRHTEESVG